jgi:hypothetical protein
MTYASRKEVPPPPPPVERNPACILLIQATEWELVRELVRRCGWCRTDARTLWRWKR